jgi:hypothetical protein
VHLGDNEKGCGELAGDEAVEEVGPGVGRLRAGRGESDEMRLSVGVDAPGTQHRLGWGVLVEPEVRSVQEQIIDAELGEVLHAEGGELVFYLLADPRHGRSRERRFVAEHLAKSRFDIAVRKSPHPGRDDEGLEGVCPRHAETEQM